MPDSAEIRRRLTMPLSDYVREFGAVMSPIAVHSLVEKKHERVQDARLQHLDRGVFRG